MKKEARTVDSCALSGKVGACLGHDRPALGKLGSVQQPSEMGSLSSPNLVLMHRSQPSSEPWLRALHEEGYSDPGRKFPASCTEPRCVRGGRASSPAPGVSPAGCAWCIRAAASTDKQKGALVKQNTAVNSSSRNHSATVIPRPGPPCAPLPSAARLLCTAPGCFSHLLVTVCLPHTPWRGLSCPCRCPAPCYL
ncbi:hypothetical protein P7K49_005954 [Saguinus oedipus]|uniref:Uncharacterized protein n=1 Tax=Saguinus oedipus TaxID=9490 RepID=A0ABQ9W3G5_SAGOE|nr:hypothetical protein P7K49_005954 [Saguinus oedipus]